MPRHTKTVGKVRKDDDDVVASASHRWMKHITVQGCKVRVELSNMDLYDADLQPLTMHLRDILTNVWNTCRKNGMDLDLSCNSGITDYGITVHIVPLLRAWPSCQRLKLFRSSVGNASLKALSPWVARGYAHELHLSDLGGTVTGDIVLQLFREIHSKGNYPHWTSKGEQAALWLRLEHNGIHNPDELVWSAQQEGISLCVHDKSDLGSVRPGAPYRSRAYWNTEISLVLFRSQQRNAIPQDDNANVRQALLTMLHTDLPAPQCARPSFRSEPHPLSSDEFQLWMMETREDAEGGANDSNYATFGDDAEFGWTFEDNLAANERLASGWTFAEIPTENESLAPEAVTPSRLGNESPALTPGKVSGSSHRPRASSDGDMIAEKKK